MKQDDNFAIILIKKAKCSSVPCYDFALKKGVMMLNRLKQNPLLAASLIVLLYGLWFVVPMFFTQMDPHAKGIQGIESAIKMWKSELITSLALALIIGLLGWWKQIGFVAVKKGGMKFLLPILAISLLILTGTWLDEGSQKWLLGFDSPMQLLSLIAVILMLGFVEEGVFRGALFYGLSTKFTPLFTVILTALLFGVFHFVNLFQGAPFDQTLYQVIHAGAMGFLYAALRLRLGAIWPLMILHGFWDFALFVLQETTKHQETGILSTSVGLSVGLPALLYGIFVYWRWIKTQDR